MLEASLASSLLAEMPWERVVVRGEIAGAPAGELFGVPQTGKIFQIMPADARDRALFSVKDRARQILEEQDHQIDIQTVRDSKIAKTFHMENWMSALGQL